jgi:hypothetical protein
MGSGTEPELIGTSDGNNGARAGAYGTLFPVASLLIFGLATCLLA